MIKKFFTVVAIVGSLALPTTAQATPTHHASTLCGWLKDLQSGAASIPPGSGQEYAGNGFWQTGKHAWELCTTPWSGVCLKSNGGWCMDDHSGVIELEPADSQKGCELWQLKLQPQGGLRLKDYCPTRRYLYAIGGLGTSDISITSLSEGTAPRDTWIFDNTP